MAMAILMAGQQRCTALGFLVNMSIPVICHWNVREFQIKWNRTLAFNRCNAPKQSAFIALQLTQYPPFVFEQFDEFLQIYTVL